MPSMRCLICGGDETNVQKLHNFPRNPARSKEWQEILGMKNTGDPLRSSKICNKHFSRDSYIDLNKFRLHRLAVPIPWLTSARTIETHKVNMEASCSGIPSAECEKEIMTEVTVPQQTPSKSIRTEVNMEASCSGILSVQSAEEIVTEAASALEDRSPISRTPHLATPTRVSRKKIFRNIEDLSIMDSTPRKKKLIKIIHRRENHLRKIKTLCKGKTQDLKALTNMCETSVVRNLFKDMPTTTANFMISQIRNFKKKSLKGRRWNLDDKILALCILKRSPRCYNLLRKFVALPNKRTVLNLLKQIPFETGINECLFKHLDENLPNGIDRCCALIFDELDIKENLQLDMEQNKIYGFEDYGDRNNHSKELANKALVFMLVGLGRKWKQPVAFYFNRNGCNSTNLKTCLFQVLFAAKHYAKVDVVTTICDMGTSNVKCMKELGVSVQHPFFLFEDEKIYSMYDPPHLLKCTVSLFRKHNILLPVTIGGTSTVMEAKFQDVLEAYERDKKNPMLFRSLHKLKDTHMRPIMQFAMKVCIAAQVCSHTVGAFLFSLISAGVIDSRAIATATFIKEVDILFDSFNGRTITAPDGKELRSCVTEGSPHLDYWQQAIAKVESWKYQRMSRSGSIKESKPPSQIGWLISLRAIREIWLSLKKKGFSSLAPRFLNQDPLENLFGSVRYGCGCGDNPTVPQFIGSLKSQILNGLANQAFVSKNCEDDDFDLISNLKGFINVNVRENDPGEGTSSGSAVQESVDSDLLSTHIADEVSSSDHKIFSVAYVAGYIIKGIRRKIQCVLCESKLVSTNLDYHNTFISFKEWSDDKSKLIYPSEDFTIFIGRGITELEEFLNQFASHPLIVVKSENHLAKNLDFGDLGCPDHVVELKKLTLKSLCRIGIPWWCKRKNGEINEIRKEKRSLRRKINKFQH